MVAEISEKVRIVEPLRSFLIPVSPFLWHYFLNQWHTRWISVKGVWLGLTWCNSDFWQFWCACGGVENRTTIGSLLSAGMITSIMSKSPFFILFIRALFAQRRSDNAVMERTVKSTTKTFPEENDVTAWELQSVHVIINDTPSKLLRVGGYRITTACEEKKNTFG